MTNIPPLANRVASLKPSATVEMSERVRSARAAGRRILGLSSGDPNLATDPRIVSAAERAVRDGATHYSAPAGLPELRSAVVDREERVIGVQFDANDVVVTPGGKFAILAALMAIVEPGDEVLVPDPGWVSYGPCVRLCGGLPVSVRCLERYDEDSLEAALTPRTRAIIVNSPSNPTGRVLSTAECETIVGVAERHSLFIIFDQVYAELSYAEAVPRLQSIPEARERIFVADSLSKSFGMTGWRVGSLLTPPGHAKSVVKFIQHSIYCVPPFVQAAAVAAFGIADEVVPAYREIFRRRIAAAAPRLDRIPGIRCEQPDATFYLFPSVAVDESAVAKRWLDKGDVAVLPGSAFGAGGRGHLRLSLACSDEELEEALSIVERLGVFGSENEAEGLEPRNEEGVPR